jgi:hypothetical protein
VYACIEQKLLCGGGFKVIQSFPNSKFNKNEAFFSLIFEALKMKAKALAALTVPV